MAEAPAGPLKDAFFQELIERSLDIITVLDETGDVVFNTSSLTRVLGHQPDALNGRPVSDFIHPEDVERTQAAIASVLLGETSIIEHEFRFLHIDGSWRQIAAVATQWNQGAVRGLVVSSRDVTDHHAALRDLRTSNELLSKVFENSSNLLSISRPDTGEFIDVNDAWCRTLGHRREDAIGRTALELNVWGSTAARQEIVRQLNESGRLRSHPSTVLTARGEIRDILIDGEVITVDDEPRILLACVDVTDARRTEQAVRQAQKMEAVGQLTGGIAHDFNNLMGVILGNMEMLRLRLDDRDLIERYVEPVMLACRQGANLTQDLLAFSSQQELEPEVLHLDSVLERMRPLLQTTVTENTQVSVQAAGSLWPCRVDPGQLRNALLNLALNARDAMPQGGSLRLEARNETASDAPDIDDGDYVVVSASDTGIGMDSETLNRVFEPFFTTKDPGQGTGLGLSMIFGFAKQSGGAVRIVSTPDTGTSVELWLPRTSPEATVEQTSSTTPRLEAQRTVLLLEDNNPLRTLLAAQLQHLGYAVIEAADETDFNALIQSDAQVDLLVSDVLLAGPRRGPELAEVALNRWPQLAVLYISGYPQKQILPGTNQPPLQKPFDRQRFAEALRRALGDSH